MMDIITLNTDQIIRASPAPEELARDDRWRKRHLIGEQPEPPFLFFYNEKSSINVLDDCSKNIEIEKLDPKERNTTSSGLMMPPVWRFVVLPCTALITRLSSGPDGAERKCCQSNSNHAPPITEIVMHDTIAPAVHELNLASAYWDVLRQRFPDLLLDSCASGGRRNDLEILRRLIALIPPDHRYDDLPVKRTLRHSGQVMPNDRIDIYAFHSTLRLNPGTGFDQHQPHDFDLLLKLTMKWKAVAYLFYGDYYHLTSCNFDEDAWMAWQFHSHEQSDGPIQVFRRCESAIETAVLPLLGLDSDSTYVFHDYDHG